MDKEKKFYKKIFLNLIIPKKNFSLPIKLYKSVDQINVVGAYNLSRFKNSMCRSFSKADRNTLGIDIKKKNNQPGPGNYRLPSEFGYYISSVAKGEKMPTLP